MTDATTTPPLFPSTANATGAKSAAAADEAAGSDTKKISSDFETFLRMLTVQMQNQDPLNPVDSTDYATQLATFSSVEQQVLTNDLLRELTAQFGGGAGVGNALQSVSGWIGMEALSEEPIAFTGAPVSIRAGYPPEADSAKLIVRNAEGEEVQSFSVDVTQRDLVWGGADGSGSLLPAGQYSFHVTSFRDQMEIGTGTAATYRPIVEARGTDAGSVVLTLSDGTEISRDAVMGLRDSPS
ncbi:hypothetical protein JYP51_00505 [Ponticoccus gilvus]|nr:hypothetical protein [Enemella evansiae]